MYIYIYIHTYDARVISSPATLPRLPRAAAAPAPKVRLS